MLNPRQKKFAERYHLTGNATQSYVEAYGTNDKTAGASSSRLLENDNIQEYLEALGEKSAKRLNITRDGMLELFYGIATDEKNAMNKDRIAAGKELNRMCGFYEPDKVELNAGDDLKEMIRRLTGAKEKI
jgi:phage terminase small subunit